MSPKSWLRFPLPSVAPISVKIFWHESASTYCQRWCVISYVWEWSLFMAVFWFWTTCLVSVKPLVGDKLFSRMRFLLQPLFCFLNTIGMEAFGWEWKLFISGAAKVFSFVFCMGEWENASPISVSLLWTWLWGLDKSLFSGILLHPISVCYQLGRLPEY